VYLSVFDGSSSVLVRLSFRFLIDNSRFWSSSIEETLEIQKSSALEINDEFVVVSLKICDNREGRDIALFSEIQLKVMCSTEFMLCRELSSFVLRFISYCLERTASDCAADGKTWKLCCFLQYVFCFL